MKITKYVHSCLLIESDQGVVLVDPGSFSWQAGLFDVSSLERLDEVAITHLHRDHYDPEFLRAITERFPDITVICNDQVERQLAEDGITVASKQASDRCQPFASEHPNLPWADETPVNTGFHIMGRLTHPGDTKILTETKDILALPITAPWCSEAEQVNMALRLKPKKVIPIHDYHWSQWARQDGYDKARSVFAKASIELVVADDGQTLTA
jgi:L-ascorbate metabolism protein UlaG (beta-lactamase superfamily)